MRPEYDGIKFYSKEDMSIGWELNRAESILDNFDTSSNYTDVNKVIELYNIQQLINIGIPLTTWTAETYEKYGQLVKRFSQIIGRYFSTINDSNFIDIQKHVSINYLDDFWVLFVKYKVYKRITPETFCSYLKMPETTLYVLMTHKELVEYYDTEFAEVLRTSDETACILASKFLEKSKKNYYLPKSFLPSEYETVFSNYIHREDARANIMLLIYKAQSNSECPISDKLRLDAKRSYKAYWEKQSENRVSLPCEIEVIFIQQNELKKFETHDQHYQAAFDIDYLEGTLEYPDILNNFRYVFEMFDIFGRSTLVSVKSKISAIEGVFSVDGIKFYKRGTVFDTSEILSNLQMSMYNAFLLEHEINLEDVFKWFFEKYLPDELGVKGFSFNIATPSATYLEKCRNLSAEMDGVLKQFRMFARDGEIDRELFEMSSEHMVIEGIPSLLKRKYAYAASDELEKEMFALFCDQSMLHYTDKTESKYQSLLDLLNNEVMYENDFYEYQIPALKLLVEKGSIKIEETGIVKLVVSRVLVLKDLYDHDVLCADELNPYAPLIDNLVQSGELIVESTLFSRPETEYLNYKLNKSQFSDGLDLRNKYAHSNCPTNEKENYNDYIQLLKLMILVIYKINDEFCARDELSEERT